jgi:hypothetical protein
MNIEISKDEYTALLNILQMAEWVMHAHETEPNAATEPYDSVVQKLFAHAQEMGRDDQIAYDATRKKYYATASFENDSPAMKFIDDFTNASFWDELTQRMTERDIAHVVGGYDQLEKLSMEDRFTRETPLMERYAEEFDEYGIERLAIVERFHEKHATSD